MSRFKLYLMGTPHLERDGVPVEPDTRRNIDLISYLALTDPSTTHAREALITLPRHISAVAATLPPDVIAVAQERGHARDLWDTAAELLVEL